MSFFCSSKLKSAESLCIISTIINYLHCQFTNENWLLFYFANQENQEIFSLHPYNIMQVHAGKCFILAYK